MFRNVSAALKIKGMTQAELAKLLNMRPATLSQKLNEKTIMTFSEAQKIKELLNVDEPLEVLFKRFSDHQAG